MNKVEIVINSDQLSEIQDIFDELAIDEFDVISIMSHVTEKQNLRSYRGAQYSKELLSRIKVETVVDRKLEEKLIDRIRKQMGNEIRIISFIISK